MVFTIKFLSLLVTALRKCLQIHQNTFDCLEAPTLPSQTAQPGSQLLERKAPQRVLLALLRVCHLLVSALTSHRVHSRPNGEQKYWEIFMLMNHIHTRAETTLTHVVPLFDL